MTCDSLRVRRPRGVVLVIVLVVVAVLALAAYSFTASMRSEHETAELHGRQLQARMMVESGVESMRVLLAQPEEARAEAGGILDNPGRFRGLLVVPGLTDAERGRVTIVAPALDADGRLAAARFGLENDSARLNLNTLVALEQSLPSGAESGIVRSLLMALPNMTEEIADSILDWLDPDDEPREYGAEADYYAGLNPPYAPKNAAVDTVEELLLVRGVTPELLFGRDPNHNGIVDAHEGATVGATGAGVPSTGGGAAGTGMETPLGWTAFLTLYSRESNLRPDGLPRVWLNNDDLAALQKDLESVVGDDLANFIIGYRQFGPSTSKADGDDPAKMKLDLNQPAKLPLSQVLELVGAKVEQPGGSKPFDSPLKNELLAMRTYLPPLMDILSINSAPTIPGRININEAPREILLGIPGMSEELVDKIVVERAKQEPQNVAERRHETWLLTNGLVDLDTMKSLMPFVTARGGVYRAQVVGFFDDGRAYSRAEVVVDATSGAPMIQLWRDLSHLGRGFTLETLGATPDW